MKKLKIHSELQTLLPALSSAEYKGLEADILANGCLSPIVVWEDMIVDGHHRYAICQEFGIKFETRTLEFDSVDDAKLWAWSHQEHRRNLTPYQRTEIALKFKPMLATKAKEKELSRKSTLANSPKSSEEINVRAEVAKIANVGENTVSRVEFLDKHADEETKAKLRNNETTINREYTRLRSQPDSEFKSELAKITGPGYVEGEHKSIVLQHILLHDPVSLIDCLFGFFDQTYREKLVLGLLERAENEDGHEFVRRVTESLLEKYHITQ